MNARFEATVTGWPDYYTLPSGKPDEMARQALAKIILEMQGK